MIQEFRHSVFSVYAFPGTKTLNVRCAWLPPQLVTNCCFAMQVRIRSIKGHLMNSARNSWLLNIEPGAPQSWIDAKSPMRVSTQIILETRIGLLPPTETLVWANR